MEGRIRSSLLHPEIQPASWKLIAGAAIIVAVCFTNSLPNDFILDDHQVVALNPAIRAISPLQFLRTPYWGVTSDSGIYRPLSIFSFSLEYPLWRQWAGGYRLTNLLLHTINGILVFFVARSLLQSAAAAGIVGAIYLAHPVHTEPVVGLAGRSELLAALFFFSAWILFRKGRTVWCAVVFLLALFSKENAIALPGVLLLDALIAGRSRQKIRETVLALAPVCSAAILYLGVRLWVLGRLGVPQPAQYLEGTLTFAQRVLTSGRVFLKYFQLLLAPVNVTGDYDFNSIPVATPQDGVAWLGLALIVLTIVVAMGLIRTQPIFAFAILFFYVTMFPTSNWIMPTAIIMSERGLYLPSLAVCLVVGLFWARVANAPVRRLLAGGVIATAAMLCIAHNYLWRDDLTYYGNMVRVLPNNVRGRQGYGVALTEAGHLEVAKEQFEAGLAIKRNAPLLVGLGQALMQMDRGCGRAGPVLEEALTIQPSDPFARWLIGRCLETEDRLQEAEASYRKAIDNTQFPHPKMLADWGRTLEKTGRHDEAQEAYRRAALLN